MRRFTFGFLLLLMAAPALGAGLRLPFVFSDDMVLQRDMPDPIWGHAEPGDKITVQFAGQEKTAITDADGNWTLKLAPMPANAQGQEMSVLDGDQTIAFKNILIGEVWLCSGQSNMEKPIGEHPGEKPTTNYKQEIAAADHPLIRLLLVPEVKGVSLIKTRWEVCSPDTVESEHFSAVGYFFGRRIQHDVQVPVGLIDSSWGGTRIEPWTNPEGFASVPSLQAFVSYGGAAPAANISGPGPSKLYNVMIKPMVPFAIRGAIWYQGESNILAHDAPAYFDKMHALINGWRQAWGEGDFPFYYVQLAPFIYSGNKADPHTPEELPEVWDIQRRVLSMPHTGMAVITDLVSDPRDIHPTRKAEVGERLALWALAHDYGKKDLVFSGPLFKSLHFAAGKAIVEFDHAEGLKTSDGKPPSYFEIAGGDGKFVPADAKIDGQTITLSATTILDPKSVRFGWRETAMPNLINGAGLPASPFKSDP